MHTSKNYRFSVIIEKDEESYCAACPKLQGCYIEGDTYKEVIANIKDVNKWYLNDLLDCGEEIPQTKSVGLTTLDVII